MALQYMCSNCGAEMHVSDQEILNLAQTTGLFQKRLQCAICSAFIAIPDARLMNRSELSGYRIRERVEVDGVREIYSAEHIQTNQIRNVQVLHSPLIENGDHARLFLNAMNRFMQLKHPNLIRILDAGQTSGGIYFVAWQPPQGVSLGNRLWEGGAMELKPALQLASLIGQVLEWLWSQHGLIYGSLSPRRVWITPDNNILVFNTILSPLTKDQPPSFSLDALMAGLPGFMSPELLRGSQQLDCRTDIYSLGATLYNMLTGSAPFCGLNAQQIQESQASASLADPRTLKPDLPEAVVEFLKSTLASDPADRPQDWKTLLDQLSTLQKDKPLSLPPLKPNQSVLIQLEPSLVPPPSKKVVFIRTSRDPVAAHHPAATHPPAAKPAPATHPSRAFHLIIASGIAAVLLFIAWLVAISPPPAPKKPVAHAPSNSQATESAKTTAAQATPPLTNTTNTVARALPASNPFDTLYKATQEYLKTNPTDYDGLLAKYDALITLSETAKPHMRTQMMDERHGIQMTKSVALDRATEEIQQKAKEFTRDGRYEEGASWLTLYQGSFALQTRDLRNKLSSELNLLAQAKSRETQATQSNEQAVQRQTFLTTLSKAVLQNNLEQARQMLQPNTVPDATLPKAEQAELLQQLALLGKLPDKIMDHYRDLIGKTIKLELVNGPMNGKLTSVGNQELTMQPFSPDGEIVTLPVPLAKIQPLDVLHRLDSAPPTERALLQGFYAWQQGDAKLALANFSTAPTLLLASALASHISQSLNQSLEADAQKALAALVALTGITPEHDDPVQIAKKVNELPFTDAQCTQIKKATQRFTELYGQTQVARTGAPLLGALATASPIARKIDLETVEAALAPLKDWKSGGVPLLFSYRVDGGLVYLDLSENKSLPNLSALKALPFKELSFRKCGITRLPPLEGFHIIHLDLSESAITDLSGIKNATIEELNISGTSISNLQPLRSHALRVFCARNCPNLSDLSGLTTTGLTWISLAGSSISSLATLEGAPLASADFTKCTLINDLKPLAQCPLKELSFAGCNRISMLYALKGLPLRKLDISGTTVSDLNPLAEMPLESLNLADARNIADLSPLVSNPKLKVLTLPNEIINTTCLRSHKSLEYIGYPTPVETATFWKKRP